MEEVSNHPLDNEQQEEEEEEESNLMDQESGQEVENEAVDEEQVDGGEGGGQDQGQVGEPLFEDAEADEGFEGEVEDGEGGGEVGGGEEGFLNNEVEDEEVPEEGEGHPGQIENGEGEGEIIEGEGEPDPADLEEIAMMQLILPDSHSLYDVALGFEPESNIKIRMNGFSSKYQDYFFPLIDSQSGVLFEIVQEVERAVYKSNEDLLRAVNVAVAIPASRLVVKAGGPDIRVRVMDPSEPLISVESSSSPSVSPPQSGNNGTSSSSGAAGTRSHAPPMGWQKTKKTPESIQMEKQITPAEKAFSVDKLAKLMVPFGHGWKREIVIRSHGGGASKKLGDVYYFSPEGTKYRSSKQVAIYLNKHPALKMSVENFSFAKARVSYDADQESVRAAQGGRNLNPVKNMLQHKQIGLMNRAKSSRSFDEDGNDSGTSNGIGGDGSDSSGLPGSLVDSEPESILKGRGGRRSIQPPKRYATAEFIPEPAKRAKMSQKSLEKESDNYSSGRGGGMQMGMLHPKYRPTEEEKTGEQMLQEFRARRGRPVGKGGLPIQGQGQGQAQHNYQQQNHQQGQLRQQQNRNRVQREDGPMFGISALTQGASFSNFTEALEYGGTLSATESEGYEGDVSLDMDDGGGGGNKAELLPCSIRCPGMTGEIPTLQCKRCLCLYHPGCLGLPKQPYRNFFCSNCEGDDGSSSGGASSSSGGVGSSLQKPGSRTNVVLMKGGIRVMKQRSEPPPLIHLNTSGGGGGPKFGQAGMRRILPKMPILQGGRAPGQVQGQGGQQMMMNRVGQGQGFQRLAPPVLIRPGMQMSGMGGMRRGRGRPPRMGMNSGHPSQGGMNRGSVTITPISINQSGRGGGGGGGRGGLQNHGPIVPRLQPMSGGAFMRGGIRKPGPGMMQQQYQQQMGGQQQMMRSRGGGQVQGTRPQFVVNPHQQMQLLRRGGLAPRQRMQGAGVRLPGLRNSPIFRMDIEGRVTPRVGGSGLVMGQSPPTTSHSSIQNQQFGGGGGGGAPAFQRYAQSVVTINQKKYLALPKNSSGAARPTTAENAAIEKAAIAKINATISSIMGTGSPRASQSQSQQGMMRTNSNSSSPSSDAPANPLLAQRRAEAAAKLAARAASAGVAPGEAISTSEYETSDELSSLNRSEDMEGGGGPPMEESEEDENQGHDRENGGGSSGTDSVSPDISSCSELFGDDIHPLSDVNLGGLKLEPEKKKELLMRVLEKLPDYDKFKVRSVAKLWKSAIDDPEMWKSCSLSGLRVKNWTLFQQFVRLRKVVELDTRGAVIPDMEEFWQQLLALDYSCSSASTGKCHLARILVSSEVAEWSEGTLLKEFQDTGSAEIHVMGSFADVMKELKTAIAN